MKHIATLVLTLGLLAAGAGQAQASSILIDTQSFGGHTYQLWSNAAGITWNTANSEATGLGGYLAVMESAAENAFVAGRVALNPSLYNSLGLGPWLGGFSPADHAAFQWVNGASFASFSAPWQAGQPDWAEASPQGLLYYNGGPFSGSNWGDYGAACGAGAAGCGAGNVLGYVVEFNSVPEPATISLLGLGLIGLGATKLRGRKK